MRLDLLDHHSRIDSPVHRLPAGVKLAATVGVVLGTLLVPPGHAAWLGVFAAGLLLVAALSRIPPRALLLRLLLIEPFVLGVAALALFQPGGWRLMLLLVVRCTICVFAMILLSNTTPFSQILRVLRRIRVPALLITTLALMYRYLFVLLDESHRMNRARAARTFETSRRRRWSGLAGTIGHLFVRASERAERIYAAMCARGWQ